MLVTLKEPDTGTSGLGSHIGNLGILRVSSLRGDGILLKMSRSTYGSYSARQKSHCRDILRAHAV